MILTLIKATFLEIPFGEWVARLPLSKTRKDYVKNLNLVRNT